VQHQLKVTQQQRLERQRQNSVKFCRSPVIQNLLNFTAQTPETDRQDRQTDNMAKCRSYLEFRMKKRNTLSLRSAYDDFFKWIPLIVRINRAVTYCVEAVKYKVDEAIHSSDNLINRPTRGRRCI